MDGLDLTFPREIPDDEHVEAIMRAMRCGRREAEFILALERGETDGDLVELPG